MPDKPLSTWSKENDIHYMTAYRRYLNNELPNAYKKTNGRIMVREDNIQVTPVGNNANLIVNRNIDFSPKMVYSSQASENKTRRNAASTIIRTDRFKNIEDGLAPYSINSKGKGNVNIRDAITLCQKAYYNFASFRNVIDLMTEFSISNIYFKGGSKKSRDFFEGLFEAINIWGLQDRFYREFFRSGNVFIYRFDGKIDEKYLLKINESLGNESIAKKVTLPVKYIILNPSDVETGGTISFASALYFKILNNYELSRLRNPQTEEDRAMLEKLEPEVKKLIKSKSNVIIPIRLDPENTRYVFYKKQDYEPLAVPLGYPVLEDINWKAELKKMDMAISRTVQQAVLLINVGAELKDGTLHFNKGMVESLQELFANESVGRVLISDWTTKATFVIPDIANILTPAKYEVVERDIQLGLNNILVGEEKFANQQIKVEVFVERLQQARRAFNNEFLIPEIKRIADEIGLKNYPTPHFEDVNLRDKKEYAKIYSRLLELGALTPEETFIAIDTGRLPTDEESLESQQKFKQSKDKGLYEPLLGGPKEEEGRPTGSKAPQTTKKVSPIGASFSINKLKETMVAASKLDTLVKEKIMKKYKLKKLNEKQDGDANELTHLIIANEDIDKWNKSVDTYLTNPVDTNHDRIREIREIQDQHQTTFHLASILYHTKIDNAS
jgi:hypothetical protein